MKKIYNPFDQIGGSKALLLGLLFMAVTTPIAFWSHTHFDGALDAHIGQPSAPFYIYIIEAIVAWLVPGLILYITGRVLAGKGRVIDMLGVAALARFPFLFIALINKWMPEIDPTFLLAHPEQISVSSLGGMVLLGLLSLVFIIWFVALLFNGFKICFHLKKSKLIWGFIAGLLFAELISFGVFHLIFGNA